MHTITEGSVPSLDAAPRHSGSSQAERRSSTKILVVDHHFLIREALCAVLKRFKSNATILEAVDGRQAMQLFSEHADIGFVLLELNLPDRDGFSLLSELRERHPAVSIVVLSARQDRDSVVRALHLGALGFIPKSGQREVIVRALGLVFAGGVYIPPEILSSEERLHPSPKPTCSLPATRRLTQADFSLTVRQADVLRIMMKGKSNKEISRALNMALPTVRNHVTAILKTMKMTKRSGAAIAAHDMDWECAFVKSSATLDGRRQSLLG